MTLSFSLIVDTTKVHKDSNFIKPVTGTLHQPSPAVRVSRDLLVHDMYADFCSLVAFSFVPCTSMCPTGNGGTMKLRQNSPQLLMLRQKTVYTQVFIYCCIGIARELFFFFLCFWGVRVWDVFSCQVLTEQRKRRLKEEGRVHSLKFPSALKARRGSLDWAQLINRSMKDQLRMKIFEDR